MRKYSAYYVRNSDAEIDQEQVSLIKEHLKPNPTEVKIFWENQSGFSRPEFEHLLDHAQTGQLELVIVSSLDRLDLVASTEHEFLSFFKTLSENGVQFASVAEGLDSKNTAAEFYIKLDGAISKAREIVRGERIKISLKRTKDEGTQLGRPRAANYDDILNLRSKGLSIQEIATKLEISRGAVQHCLKTKVSPDLSPA